VAKYVNIFWDLMETTAKEGTMSVKSWFATALVVFLMVAVPWAGVRAQEEPAAEDQPAEEQPTEEAAAPEEAAAQPKRFMEEVIVTAQKREESLQNVSASVNAFTGEDLRALEVSTTVDIGRLVSNADIKTSVQGVNPNITVRGIGMNNYNSNNNPTVGVYVNEVFLSSPAMLSLFMMDLERTEVLKGPQGTLYGRNTNGGAINIISKKPSQETDIFATVAYGAYDTLKVEGAVGGGLSDAWSGRLSFLYDNQDESYYDNIATGENMGSFENIGLRGQLRYDRAGPFTMNLSLSYLEQSGVSGMQEIYNTGGGDPEDPLALCPEAAAMLAAGSGADVTQLPRGGCVSTVGTYDPDDDLFRDNINPSLADRYRIDSDVMAAGLDITYDFSGATLTSITGYIAQDRLYGEGWYIPGDMFFAQHDEEIWQFSQELRLNGSTNKIGWIAGLFYSQDQIETFNPIESPSIFGGFFGLNPVWWEYDQETTSAAVFGSLDFYLSDTITLVAGLRYTDEEFSFAGGTTALLAGGPLETTEDVLNAPRDLLEELGIPLTFVDDTISDDNVSGRVALEVRPSDNLLAYGSVSTGFKSGQYYGDFTVEQAELEPTDPETVTAYEVGVKSQLANGNVQLNGALFYNDYKDIQTIVIAPFGYKFDNVEKASITGLDLELIARPLPGLDILLGAGWLDTEMSSQLAEFDGNELPNAPEYQFNGMIRYSFGVSDKIWLAPLVAFKTTDDKWTEAFNIPLNYSPGYSTFDFRLSLFPPDYGWELAVWAQNFTDEKYFEEVFWSDVLNSISTIPGAPSTWGVSFSYYF
jgi:iron complex outermembrane receptor protein